VARDPAIDAWFESRAGALAMIARPWYERLRDCGDDVRELLHDGHPAALLEGTGKNMRHVKLRPGSEIDPKALAALIQAAYSRVRFLNNIKGDASHG
jgi:hypothetical protein